MTVRIGTSGWQYRDWSGPVYPKGLPQRAWLEHYAARFATVESNRAFYQLPERHVFERWAELTPDDFRMAVKASRYLTHILRLRDPADPVGRLLEAMEGLGPKAGPVLLQLPPRFPVAVDRLDATLAAFPPRWQVAVEVRDASWEHEEVRAVLEAHGAALCLADRRHPLRPLWRTVPWTYLRFHEGTATPRPCYGRTALATWARRLLEGWGPDADAWVYFNNDPRACAVANAVTFARCCRALGMDVARAS